MTTVSPPAVAFFCVRASSRIFSFTLSKLEIFCIVSLFRTDTDSSWYWSAFYGDKMSSNMSKINVLKFRTPFSLFPNIWASTFRVCDKQRRRPACASAPLFFAYCKVSYPFQTCYQRNFNFLGSLCS